MNFSLKNDHFTRRILPKCERYLRVLTFIEYQWYMSSHLLFLPTQVHHTQSITRPQPPVHTSLGTRAHIGRYVHRKRFHKEEKYALEPIPRYIAHCLLLFLCNKTHKDFINQRVHFLFFNHPYAHIPRLFSQHRLTCISHKHSSVFLTTPSTAAR